MQNQFHHIFNNRFCMALLILALVGLVSFSYISSVFAPTTCAGCVGGYKQFQKSNLAGRSFNQNQNQTTTNSTKPLPANSIQ